MPIEAQSGEDTTNAVKAPEDSKTFYLIQMTELMHVVNFIAFRFCYIKNKILKNVIILLVG